MKSKLMKNKEDEFQILVTAITGPNPRLSVKNFTKKSLKGNQIKYTIIVEDSAIPDKGVPATKKAKKVKVIEVPKNKVVITKKENEPKAEKKPVPPPRPAMAEITSIGLV